MHGNSTLSIQPFNPMLLMTKGLLLALALVLLSACAGRDTGPDLDPAVDAEELYDRAYGRLQGGNYQGALQMLRQLEARYPFTPQGQQAQLDQIYAYYRMRDRQGTNEAARRYIRENPRSEHLAYAYYMQGMAWFDQRASLTRRAINLDPARLDISNAQRSFDAFRDLVERFPDSEYSDDARMRMVFLRNLIARHHWHVANHYLDRGAYMAAVARATTVIEDMQPNSVTPYMLELMAEAYENVGESDLAEDVRGVLARSYPDHERGERPHFF
ncbi:outer membrane protein assembly factor BamD [Natronospira proteinivora]|uniref:Outer membrane protein assembly factor BamD n=1 Tax=Natronospira proteinivora TaxID=1807133 RepID=A0ABT1G848_9GAMM|nr:outer membrane protein assembly factor BamD [Natronospira proteinivora]MCP1727487.1 outer membrane protein assembly factor BamD [Natronospira proteinivora]